LKRTGHFPEVNFPQQITKTRPGGDTMHRNGQVTLPVNGSDSYAQALNLALDDLDRRFGPGVVMKLGEADHLCVRAIPTGFPALDQALGVGGLPRGRITDLYGPEGSGKTTLCLHTIAEAQQRGGLAAFIDTEHALDPAHAARCRVNLNRLYIAQPTTGEEALEIVEAMVRAGLPVVAVDSVAGLLPRAELEGEMGEQHAGLQSRLMSQALRKLAGPVRRHDTLLIFTNQLRYLPPCDSRPGSTEKPTGGMALRFHASVRIDLRRVRSIKSAGEVIGCRIRATIQKNKVATPFRWAEFDIFYYE
jgi:recombination protein RecA